MPSETRTRRLADRIREELAEILMRQAADPRLAGMLLTGVDVDREFAYATIHVTALEGSGRRADILRGLRAARGFLRSALASRIPLRSFPRLRFRWDETTERAAAVDAVLARLRAEEGALESGRHEG
jgi:ribosome-binding factor A